MSWTSLLSKTKEHVRRATASPTAHCAVPILQTTILAWLAIITWRYLLSALDNWAAYHEHWPHLAESFYVLLISWLVVIATAFAAGLSAKPLARRLGIQIVLALALAALVLVAILSRTLLGVLAFLWLLLLAFGIGARLLRVIFGRQVFDSMETTVFSLGLGFGMYYLFTFALALGGLLYKWVAVIVLLLLSVLLRRELLAAVKGTFRGLRDLPSRVTSESRDFLSASILSIFAFLVVINFIGAIGPEIGWDPVVYQLNVPKIYIQNHRLVEIPYIFRSYFPKGVNMIFCLGLLVGGQVTAKLLNFGFGLVTAAGIFAFARHTVSRKAGLLAAVLFYSAPLTSYLAMSAYVELGWTLFTFLAMYALCRWLVTRDEAWIVMAGLMSGIALSAKTATWFLIVPMVIAAVVAGLWVHESGAKASIKRAVGLVLVSGLVGGPWYVLTYLFTGNPVFPFLNAIFRSPQWPAVNSTFNFPAFGTGRDLFSLARLPWDMTFQSTMFGEAPHGAIGVGLLIALALPLVAARAVPKDVALLAFLALFCSVEWVLAVEYLRYYLPYLPVISILGAYVVDRACYSQQRWVGERRRAVALALVDVVLVLGLAATWPIRHTGYQFLGDYPYRVALGLESREEYLLRHWPWSHYDYYRFLNSTYDDETLRILDIGNGFSLYSDHDVLPAKELLDRPDFNLAKLFEATDQGEVLDSLRHLAVTHLVIPGQELDNSFLTSRPFLEACTEVQYEANGRGVYRLLSDSEIQRRALYRRTNPELLLNSSFEDGGDGVPALWQPLGSRTLDRSGVHSRSADGSVLVSEDGSFTQAVPVLANRMYVLSQYVKAGPGGESARLQVAWMDADGNMLSWSGRLVPVTSQWREFHQAMMAPKDADAAVIWVAGHDPGDVWVDDLSFKLEVGPLPAPESFSSCIQLNAEEAEGQLGPGWYGIEEEGSNRWRWMSREAWLLLGTEKLNDVLTITGKAVTKGLEGGGILLRVSVNEQAVGEAWLEDGDFALAFEVPHDLLGRDEFVTLRLQTGDAFVPEGELRELGAIVHSVCFK
jgi:hypothetical protein